MAQKYKNEIIGHGVSGLVIALDDHTCSKSGGYSDNEWCENQTIRDHNIERRIYERLGHHPRICKFLGFKERGVIMQRYPDCLRRRLLEYQKSGIITSPEDAWRWSLQVSEGFAHIHSKNVLQTDISSGNILLAEDDSAVICDFAGSSIDGEIAQVACGTRYQRTWPGRKLPDVPELQDEIFALGCLVYEIWTTKQPYQGEDEKVVERYYGEGRYPDVEYLPVAQVVCKCWNGSYDSVQDIVEELQLSTPSAQASQPSPPAAGQRLGLSFDLLKRHGAIILLSSAILAYYLSRSSPR